VAPPLTEVLAEARQLGFLGPGPVEAHVEHAQGFLAAAGAPPSRFLDLGSGGGVPGLVLAQAWPASHGVLLDGSDRRTAFLRRAVVQLGLAARARVVTARAEVAGHDPELRFGFDLVVARGFGAPAVTLECGAAFLQPGATLLVSDPPDGEERWPDDLVSGLGLVLRPRQGTIRVFNQQGPYPENYPRRRPGR
jgi:16S rRNA (guanine527-N7)-methyltransferase